MKTFRHGFRFFPHVLLLILCSLPLEAQYFGRNKVQWESFDFKVLQSSHFDIYYYDEEKDAAEDVARMAERWYTRLSGLFDHQFARKPIVLYANHPDFQQTTVSGGLIGEGTGGFTDSFKNRIVLPLTGSYAETDHVLGHEMVHVFQYDLAGAEQSRQRRYQLEQLPLWMVEGLAEYFSQGTVDPQTAMWMRDATLHDMLPDYRKLSRDPRFSPYQYGQAFWAYIGGRYGDDDVTRLFVASAVLGIERAFQQILGRGPEEILKDWNQTTRNHYADVIASRQAPPPREQAFIGAGGGRSSLNVAPSISPDGRSVAFLSTRDLFSIDLFVADVATGRVSKLVSTAGSPHFDALRFIDSAGSWSPDSSRIAFVVFEKGDNRLAILDVGARRVSRTIAIPGVEALSNPAWSPDGRQIAVSGQVGGITDLFLYELETGTTTRLTSDRFADLQPVFSPDGRSLAWVTDRGEGTTFQDLAFRPYTIAMMDISTRSIRNLPLFESSKNINPQFSGDGKTLFFIAAPEGISDIYSYGFADNAIHKLTNVATGVTGITEASPAMSVSQRGDVIVYSLLEAGTWSIHKLDASSPQTAVRAITSQITPAASVLPPGDAASRSTVQQLLADDRSGLLPEETDLPSRKYRSKLSLDYVGPPSIGIGTDRYGLGVGGSLSMYFSDMLGKHQVGVSLAGGSSGGSSLGTQFGGQVFYLNQEHRINWGAIGAHVPYVSSFATSGTAVVDINGQPTLVDVVDQYREIVTVDEAYFLSQYPFSVTRRMEANVGYSRLGYDAEVERFIVSGNQIIDSETFDQPSPPDLNYYRAALAFVGDSSSFGFVSPVRGTRYRFEVENTSGDLQYQTGLADYRHYFFMRPATFAVRGLHYGRYGDDAELERPLNVGRPSLVRGYDAGSFNAAECTAPAGSDICPEYDRLLGSRIGVVNAELRIPLFGTEEFGLIHFESLPTELVAFADAGVAWSENESADIRFDEDTTDRVPVFSAGVAARIVLGGYIPIEVYAAKPFQRPQEDWSFGFMITPGW